MAIVAKNTSQPRELTEAGNHVGYCIKMIEIGTTLENVMGTEKHLHKVNLTFELPLVTKVFEESKGPQPLVVSKEFTLSMGEKANLRKMLESWRGSPFTEEQAKNFDITVLLGKPCMINLTHKASKKDPSIKYDEISAITPVPKGMTYPKQVNPSQELSYDKWDEELFKALPDFIKNKIVTTPEYKAMRNPDENKFIDEAGKPIESDLPWDAPVENEETPLF